VSKISLIADYEITKPKSKKTTDMHPYLMLEPTKVDYRRPNEDTSALLNAFTRREEIIPYFGDLSRED
jgi:hypothetical protein